MCTMMYRAQQADRTQTRCLQALSRSRKRAAIHGWVGGGLGCDVTMVAKRRLVRGAAR